MDEPALLSPARVPAVISPISQMRELRPRQRGDVAAGHSLICESVLLATEA